MRRVWRDNFSLELVVLMGDFSLLVVKTAAVMLSVDLASEDVKLYSQLMVDCSRPVSGSGGRSVSLRMRVYDFAVIVC